MTLENLETLCSSACKEFRFSVKTVRQVYTLSKMTVINEIESHDSYFQLRLVEFLEAVCRLAYNLDYTEELKEAAAQLPYLNRLEMVVSAVLTWVGA